MSDTTEFKRQRADEAEYRRQRVHDDFNASNEAARAAAQAAILINGGAATALLAFLSKVGTPPFIVRGACVSLGLYALGVVCGTLSIWYSAQAAGQFASAELGTLRNDSNAATDLEKARRQLERHRMFFPVSLVLFVAATVFMAIRLS